MEKKLVVVGNSHLDVVCDTHSLLAFPSILNGNWPEWKDNALIWLLTRFYLPFSQLCESGRFSLFLKASATDDFSQFSLAASSVGIDTNALIKFYLDYFLNKAISISAIDSSCDSDNFYSTLYISTSKQPYNEKSCIRRFVSWDAESDVTLQFPIEKNIDCPTQVRFDPTNQANSLFLKDLWISDSKGIRIWEWNGAINGLGVLHGIKLHKMSDFQGVLLECITKDPQIELTIDADILTNLPYPVVFFVTLGKVDHLVFEKINAYADNKLKNLSQTMAERDAQLTSLGQVVAERDAELRSLGQVVTERDAELTSLGQVVAERDAELRSLGQVVTERDAELTSLGQVVAERDAELTSLGQVVAERDAELTSLGQVVADREAQLTSLGQVVADREAQLTSLGQVVADREAQLTSLSQTLLESDIHLKSLSEKLVELDAQILSLGQALVERDYRIDILNRTLSECNYQMEVLKQAVDDRDVYHKQTLDHIRNSTSWRLTEPLRSLVTKLNRSRGIFKLLSFSIAHDQRATQTTVRDIAIYNGERLEERSRVRISDQQKLIETDVCEAKVPSDINTKSEILQINFDETYNQFVTYKENRPINPLVKLIAFYLPQFHPFPENDEWWGKGFTEWTNVGKAKPNFDGHYQPHCPIHSGYYDLRVSKVMEDQANLAKEYGIYGFSYYFYWFDGKILMDTPLEQMLANKKVDIPFCLTWANENWSRRWDGQENDILIAQNHSFEDSLAFISHLIKYFKDDRYIRVDGKPILIIYRANIIPDMVETTKIWRDELYKHGFPGLYIISAQSFGIRSPEEFDFDASVEFPPHTVKSGDISNEVDFKNPDFNGHVYSYEQVAANAVISEEPDYKLYRTAMLSWDNTARKQNNSHIFHGFSLLRYKQWLSSLVNKVYTNSKYSSDEKIVFVNAWNEWAEGTHLEPDQKFGYGYLQTTYDVLCNYDATKVDRIKGNQNPIKTSDYAVILHLHYDEVWTTVCQYLRKSFNQKFDLFVTVTNISAAEKVKIDFPYAHIELVENRGRDILPFIHMLRIIINLDYLAVCKLHSKRSVYRDDGDSIRNEIFEALIGSKQKVNKILSRFRNAPNLGMVAPKDYLIKHTDHNMTFDKELVEAIANQIALQFRYDIFPAGSMFWFAPKSLSALLSLDHTNFGIESGLVDGTYAHAIERLFCQIVCKAKLPS